MIGKQGSTKRRNEPHIEGFEFIRHLGEGGFANTYLYRDLRHRFGDYVVAKVPKDKLRELSMIKGDVASLIALKDQKYIVEYCDIRCVRDTYILLMEYVEGLTLRELIGPFGNGRALPVPLAFRYAIQIAYGLRDAHHRNLVHRDIKPDNIIIEKKRDIPRILDFGIATLQREGSFKTSLYRHTMWYSPIEILKEGLGDQRVDVFSFGVTFFEMLTGTLPYYQKGATDYQLIKCIADQKIAPSVREFNDSVPIFLDKIIQKAIAPNKEDRYFSVEEMLSELEPPAEISRARSYFDAGKPRVAEKILSNLIQQRPNDPRVIAELALLKNRCHEYREAITQYEKAIQYDPCNPDLFKEAGVACLKAGDKEKALLYLEKSLNAATSAKQKRSVALLLKDLKRQDKK